MKASGYAVTVAGEIDVRTVSPTECGAKVNGLVTLHRVIVHSGETDDAINRLWGMRTMLGGQHQPTEIVPVDIQVAQR